MKCQSDYDAETDALLRQADDCMKEWWEGEPPKSEEPSRMAREEDESTLIVKKEVRKRGLLEVDEEARL
jgi:hypothetical protein